MTTSHMTTVMDAVATRLAGIAGVPTGGVLRVGQFAMSLIGQAPNTAFPRILLRLLERRPLAQSGGAHRPIQTAMRVAILTIDDSRTTSDPSWSADRAEELERLVDAALLSDWTLGGIVQDIIHESTRYNPELEGVQIDASVIMTYEIRTQVRFGDLSTSAP